MGGSCFKRGGHRGGIVVEAELGECCLMGDVALEFLKTHAHQVCLGRADVAGHVCTLLSSSVHGWVVQH
jgi:hypothetical protein